MESHFFLKWKSLWLMKRENFSVELGIFPLKTLSIINIVYTM